MIDQLLYLGKGILEKMDNQKLNFECIECGKPLKCVLNDENVARHVRHKSIVYLNCNPTPESLLHKTAKKLIGNHQ